MRNINFKTSLINFTAILIVAFFITSTLSSCQKEQETIAVIIVKDVNNNRIGGASVTLHQDGQINDQGEYSNSSLNRTEKTDENGRAQFTYGVEAVLKIEVLKIDGNDTLIGSNVIRLIKEKIITETVTVFPY